MNKSTAADDPNVFYGNMGQPETPQEFKNRYGVWPSGHEPEEEAPVFIGREGEMQQLYVNEGGLIMCSKENKWLVAYGKVVEITTERGNYAIRITYKRWWGVKHTRSFFCKNETDFQRCVKLLNKRAKWHITC